MKKVLLQKKKKKKKKKSENAEESAGILSEFSTSLSSMKSNEIHLM